MTDENRCEPLEYLRGSDGEHFVCGPNGLPFVALWHAAPHSGIEPLWHNAARTSTGTPAWAANEWGWRYLAPVTPHATVTALVEALEGLIDVQMFATGWDNGVTDATGTINEGDNWHGLAMDRARAAFTLYIGGTGQ